jgi:hypothetical protein
VIVCVVCVRVSVRCLGFFLRHLILVSRDLHFHIHPHATHINDLQCYCSKIVTKALLSNVHATRLLDQTPSQSALYVLGYAPSFLGNFSYDTIVVASSLSFLNVLKSYCLVLFALRKMQNQKKIRTLWKIFYLISQQQEDFTT